MNENNDDMLDKRLFDLSIGWLRSVERRDFYPKLVEFCAAVLDSEVCALFVKTTQLGDGTPRVCLVAGKLPPGHSKGQRMVPDEVGGDPIDHSYKITTEEEQFDGVTGRIATTGEAVYLTNFDIKEKKAPGHAGKWDKYVWEGQEKTKFKCMLGVPIVNNDRAIIGVIKVENKLSGSYSLEDQHILTQIGEAISGSLQELINQRMELTPEIDEYEYRVPRSVPCIFEKNKSGEVIIRHSMTAICHSDVYYFEHNKSRKKLDERLPMVLGHETTGEVYQVVGESKYPDGTLIQQKDKVVVIPLIPCWTCKVCAGKYGENYCPSSKFMASNAPGSLRTVYKYHPKLILKITDQTHEKYALFTEPMSNVVQMLDELGFVEGGNRIEYNMAPFGVQEFNYFHVDGDSFSNIFDSITAEEPNPRTLFVLKNQNNSTLGFRTIKHNNIMIKGLGLLGNSESTAALNLTMQIPQPKILILGGGTMGYLLAILLFEVYKISKDRIVVTGRNSSKLQRFKDVATRKPIQQYIANGHYHTSLTQDLIYEGDPGGYDIVFECVGWPAVGENIDLAMQVLKPGGIIALEGLADQGIGIDFHKLLSKNLLLKGFYRGSMKSYQNSLRFIEQYPRIRMRLDPLIDNETQVNNQIGLHCVSDEIELSNLFKASIAKESFGRLVISKLF